MDLFFVFVLITSKEFENLKNAETKNNICCSFKVKHDELRMETQAASRSDSNGTASGIAKMSNMYHLCNN